MQDFHFGFSPVKDFDLYIRVFTKQAFIQASQRKRATFLLLEMSKNATYPPQQNTHQGMPLPRIPSADEEESVTYYNQNGTKSNNSSSNSEDFDMTEEFEVGT